jgi:RIO-like serine/threonine protein kinase
LTDAVERGIIDAFHAIHGLGVVHGDVRADNIVVREDGKVWIVDFEFAEIVTGNHRDRELLEEMNVVQDLLKGIRKQRDESVGHGRHLSQNGTTLEMEYETI